MECSASYELLLISCASGETGTTAVVNGRSGVQVWSLQNLVSDGGQQQVRTAQTVWNDRCLLLTSDKGLVHLVDLMDSLAGRLHVRSVLPNGRFSAFVANRQGSLCCASIEDRLYVWSMSTGRLVSVLPSGHYQEITALVFSNEGSFLFSAAKDGQLIVWNVADLLRAVSNAGQRRPCRQWACHSQPVVSLFVQTSGDDAYCRILSWSSDCTVKLHCVNQEQALFTLVLDREPTACSLDAAETQLFVGLKTGLIVQVSLYDGAGGGRGERQLSAAAAAAGDVGRFEGHRSSVHRLAVSLDGGLLASADALGQTIVWDVGCRQCLKLIVGKAVVCCLQFLLPAAGAEKRPLFAPLQRQPASGDSREEIVSCLLPQSDVAVRSLTSQRISNELIDRLETLSRGQVSATVGGLAGVGDGRTNSELQAEIRKLRVANEELYRFTVENLFDTDD